MYLSSNYILEFINLGPLVIFIDHYPLQQG